jgi:hypothetical protein
MHLAMLGSTRQSVVSRVLTCCGIAVAVPLCEWSLNPNATVHRLVIQYLYSLVYANCIGNLQFAVVPAMWVWSERSSSIVRWSVRAATVLVGTTVGCLVANTVLMAIVRGGYDFRAEFVGSFKISLILSSVAVAVMATFESYKYRLQATAMELKSKELERERALSVATQMRLASLQSRVHPHFLFNTINSISSLVHDDPDRAPKTC